MIMAVVILGFNCSVAAPAVYTFQMTNSNGSGQFSVVIDPYGLYSAASYNSATFPNDPNYTVLPFPTVNGSGTSIGSWVSGNLWVFGDSGNPWWNIYFYNSASNVSGVSDYLPNHAGPWTGQEIINALPGGGSTGISLLGVTPVTIHFEDRPSYAATSQLIPAQYLGLAWTNFAAEFKSTYPGYGFDYGVTSGQVEIYNVYGTGAGPAVVAGIGGARFNLISFNITAGYFDDNYATIIAYQNGVQVGIIQNHLLSRTVPHRLAPNWHDIDQVTFQSSKHHFVIDDMVVSVGAAN